MICPFCKFERTHEHENPKWECPKCLKAYSKFNSNIFKANNKKTVKEDDHSEIKDWLCIIVVFFIGFMGLGDAIVYGAIESCHHGNCWDIEFDSNPISFWVEVLIHALFLFAGIFLLLKKISGSD